MIRNLSGIESSPLELRELVKWSVAILGQVIEKESGARTYQIIEELRKKMASLREDDDAATLIKLEEALAQLRKLDVKDRLVIAHSYTLMLELMNACENAYRSFRLQAKPRAMTAKQKPDAIIYVLTSHPTEARSPQSISIFNSIQSTLTTALTEVSTPMVQSRLEKKLLHELELAWRVYIVRERKPRVKDEAEHIYTTLFKDETLSSLLCASQEVVPMYVRTWVGGDKDGHPGVDEKVMKESLSLSREHLIRFSRKILDEVRVTLELLPAHPIHAQVSKFNQNLSALKNIRAGDGGRIKNLRQELAKLVNQYRTKIGAVHPQLLTLRQLLHVFPGMVVPLELRESSDVIMSRTKGKTLAIDRMLRALSQISRGGDPRWYARGFIVSMTSSIDHLRMANRKVKKALGRAQIPVIPLFEQIESLHDAENIVHQMIHDPQMGKDIRDHWGNVVEMMVGDSDSSKEGGVLPSRLAIAQAMNRLDELCEKENVRALFFQGSGGSVDRGGGTVQDQTAWWPHSALRAYKVTVQGEMVERSLSSPEITRGQIERIAESAGNSLATPAIAPHLPILQKFADLVSQNYGQMIESPDFLRVVQKATPYPDLSELKIGSRPTRRASKVAGELSVKGLRAIPWVLCWTQTRVLFPTWWGVGSSWKKLSTEEQNELKAAFISEPVFSSYVRALGFTLAKVELSVWKIYLRNSGLEPELIQRFEKLFDDEFKSTLYFLEYVSGQMRDQINPLWFQPWLGASIRLRTPMIHPLNLLQLIAIEERDFKMLRYTVTGIASGMLTTG